MVTTDGDTNEQLAKGMIQNVVIQRLRQGLKTM